MFKNVETILSAQAIQKQAMVWIWLTCLSLLMSVINT